MLSSFGEDASPPKRLYRAFLIGFRGHTPRFKVVEATCDSHAIAQARSLTDSGLTVELWDRAKKVASIPPSACPGEVRTEPE